MVRVVGAWVAVSQTVNRLFEAVRDNVRSSAAPGFLRPIDTAQIARELNLEALAIERGRQNLPEASAQTLDMVEQQVVQRLESEWAWQGEEVLNNLRAYASRLLHFSVEAEFGKLRLAAQNALAQLRNASIRAPAELAPLQDAFVGARKELSDFRIKHRITRPPRISGGRWTAFGLLFIVTAFESVLNGFFFAKGSEFGLAGGIGTAVGISIVNVGFLFILGYGPARWLMHRSLFVKLGGLIFTAAGLMALAGLHLFAAHYRVAMARVAEDAAFREALSTLQLSPFAFGDLNSVYLFALGILFGLIAFWKGCTFDDPYPGYGKRARAEVSAREAYSEEHGLLFDDLEDIKEDTVDALRAGLERIPLFPQQAASIQNERAALVESFRTYEVSLETAMNQLLALYRDNNRTYRTLPVPAHFAVLWRRSHSLLDTPEGRHLMGGADFTRQDTSQALAEIQHLADEVLGEYQNLIVRYPHPSDMP